MCLCILVFVCGACMSEHTWLLVFIGYSRPLYDLRSSSFVSGRYNKLERHFSFSKPDTLLIRRLNFVSLLEGFTVPSLPIRSCICPPPPSILLNLLGGVDPRTVLMIVALTLTGVVCVGFMFFGWFSHLLPRLRIKLGKVGTSTSIQQRQYSTAIDPAIEK